MFAQRLKNARQMKGLSLQQLADRLEHHISRQALHKYESGQAQPEPVMIRHIAEALDVKPDYFYRDSSVSLEDVSFRKLSRLSKKEQNRVIETARDFLERYIELEQILGIPSAVSNPLQEYPIQNQNDVEKAAQKLREVWDLGSDPLYNVIELLEDHGIKVVEIEGDTAINGFSTWVSNSIPVIGMNSRLKKQHPDRYRFTLLHELGHLFLNISSFARKEQEKLCHYFSGAMLLDLRAVEQEFGLKRGRISLQELVSVKKQYGISLQAIVYRLHELSVISRKSYDHFFRFMAQNGYKNDESELAQYHGEEQAYRFDQLLGKALIEENISISKAAALKNQSIATFRKNFLLG